MSAANHTVDQGWEGVQAVLFDFFGTLVGYQPDRAALRYPRTHHLLASWGNDLLYDDFIAMWDGASADLESESRQTLREFDMAEAAAAFAAAAGLALVPDQHERLGACFVGEWAEHITPIPGVVEMLRRVATLCKVGVVSNTHDRAMVPQMLTRMEVAGIVDATVLSVDHGYCKPHPSIYQTALDRLGTEAAEVIFVGDSYVADFVGPEDAGMRSHLIDPGHEHPVPPTRRLDTVLDIEALVTPAARG